MGIWFRIFMKYLTAEVAEGAEEEEREVNNFEIN